MEDLIADKYHQHYAAFIDMAAHDLQAPLRKMGVFIDRLTTKYSHIQDDEVKQYTQRIQTCIADMQSLVDAFKEIAGAITENMQYETCELKQIVKKILQESNSLVKEKQAEISIADELPLIQGDKAQLLLLFKELFKNAFKFSKPGTPLKIDINSEMLTVQEKKRLSLTEETSYHKISVVDNGIGFGPEDSERIFEPLVRLHGKSTFSGNGLGLTLVKKITGNHKGVVYAEGSREEGARFRLIIPQTHQ